MKKTIISILFVLILMACKQSFTHVSPPKTLPKAVYSKGSRLWAVRTGYSWGKPRFFGREERMDKHYNDSVVYAVPGDEYTFKDSATAIRCYIEHVTRLNMIDSIAKSKHEYE